MGAVRLRPKEDITVCGAANKRADRDALATSSIGCEDLVEISTVENDNCAVHGL